MIGILAEKPSQAQEYARAFGGMNGTFEGQKYVIAAAGGHLFELKQPAEQVPSQAHDLYASWDMKNLPWDEKLFSWDLEVKKDMDKKTGKIVTSIFAKKQLSGIRSAFAPCDEIVIATDVDPGTNEGTLLAWEILSELGYLQTKKVTRMYPVDQSPKEAQIAFRNRKPLPAGEVACGQCRSRWDMLSMQWTRIAKQCGDGRSILRNGRLKSVMVWLVGEQLAAVKAYKKIPSYSNRFKDENNVMYINPEEPEFPKREMVPQVYKPSVVVKDSAVMKRKAPPAFLTLATLAARLSSQGFTSAAVLATYQKMYEYTTPLRRGKAVGTGIVSYPRTEDPTITPEQFKEMLTIADEIAGVVGVDVSLLTHRSVRSSHVKPQGSHGANRPGTNVPNSLDELEELMDKLLAGSGKCARAIYEMLARNFLACLAEDYEYEFQKGHIQDYPKFVGHVSVPKKPGWKAVFSDQDENLDTDDDSGTGLGTYAEPFVHEGFPPKPQYPTMSWLMDKLKGRKVGTGATRTQTYTDITSKGARYPLMEDKRGRISFTDYGEMNYRLLRGTMISDVATTEQLFEQMKQVENGFVRMEDVLAGVSGMVMHDMKLMQENGEAMRKELGITLSVPFSGGAKQQQYPEKEKASGMWKGKPVKFNREWGGHRFTDDEVDDLLAGKEISFTAVSTKTGKPYTAKGKLANQTYKGVSYVGFKADFDKK